MSKAGQPRNKPAISKEEIEAYYYSSPEISTNETARHFGLSPPTMRNRMRKLGIQFKDFKKLQSDIITSKFSDHLEEIKPSKEELQEKYSNSTLTELRKFYKINQTVLWQWLDEAGIDFRNDPKINKHYKKNLDVSDDTLKKLFDDGMIPAQIARMCNSTPYLVGKRLTSLGLTRSKKENIDIRIKAAIKTKIQKYGENWNELHGFVRESKAEKEIQEYFKERGIFLNKKYIFDSNKKRMELDLYCDQRKIAIEYNGLYYHSTAQFYSEGYDIEKQEEKISKRRIANSSIDKDYHWNKWKICNEQKIQLISIWDVEFENQREQMLDFLSAKFGLFDKRIFARNCELIKLDYKAYGFFDENHLSHRPNSIEYNYGLVYKDELIGCVSYGKHHRNSEILVLNRLAFKRKFQIVGGASRLLKTVLDVSQQTNKPILTWSDNRLSNGKIYENNGFEFVRDLAPDYAYYNLPEHKIHSKQSQKKSSVGCPDDITEEMFALKHRKYKFWDCGKKAWKFEK